jgi:nucleoside-diphosphate-sugar epimerase
MGKSLFLTGAHGFVASHLLPRLIEAGYEVETDMRYLETNKWGTIIHLAATTHTRTEFDPDIYYNNFLLTHKVFNQNCRIIYASSCSARHNTNPYASSKIWAEFLGAKHGNALGFRFHNIYGEGNTKGIVWYLMGQPDGSKITIRGKELIRDYVYVGDVVDEILRCLQWNWRARKTYNPERFPVSDGNVLDIGTGVGTTTQELVELYQDLSGKRFDISFVSADNSDPKEMVSNNSIPHVDLKTGLLKLIKNEAI